MTTSYTTPLLPRHNRLPFFEFCWAICIGFYFVSVTHVILEYQHQIPWVMKLNNTDMWAFGSTETAWGCCLQRQMISRLLARQQLKFQSFWIMYWACFQALCRVSLLLRINCDGSISWSYQEQRYSLCLTSTLVSAPAIICQILSTCDSPFQGSKIAKRNGLATPLVPLPNLHQIYSNRIFWLHWSTK